MKFQHHELIYLASNNGKNYIEDPELIKAIGRVSNTKTWENVKEPKNLLAKAQEYLKTMRNYRIAYELDAVDLQPLVTK